MDMNNNNNNNNHYSNLNYESFIGYYNYDTNIETLKDIANYLKISIKDNKFELYKEISIYLIKSSLNSSTLIHDKSQQSPSIKTINNNINFKDNNNNNNNNIEPLEISFWKVYRNYVIRKQIFSYLNNSFDYDNIIGIENTLDKYSNGVEIIKDKVKGHHTIFKNLESELELVIKNINSQSKENQQFYNQLFNNLKIKQIDNIILLQLIIQNLNLSALIEYEKIFKQDQRQQQQSYINNHYNKNKEYYYQSYKSIKLLNHLHSTQLLSVNITNDFTFNYNESFSLNKIFKFLNLNNSLIYNNNNEIINQLQHNKNNHYTIQQLKSDIKSLIIDLNNQHSNDNNNSSSGGGSGNNNSGNSCSKDNLKQIFKLLFNNQMKPIQYYFNFKNQNQINKVVNDRKLNQYEYYKDYLELVLMNDKEKEIYLSNCINHLDGNQIFSYLNYITKDIGNQQQNQNIFKGYFDEILLIGNGKLDYIIKSTSDHQVISSIKTTRLLDYLFKYHQTRFFSHRNELWKSMDMELIGYYEDLISSIGNKMLIKFTLANTVRYSHQKTNDEELSIFWNNKFKSNSSNVFDIYLRANKSYIAQNITYDIQDVNFFYDIRACISHNQQESVIKLLSSGKLKKVNCSSLFWAFHMNKSQYDTSWHYYYEEKMGKILKWIFDGLSKEYIMNQYNRADGSYIEYVEIQLAHTPSLVVRIQKILIGYYIGKSGRYDVAIDILKSGYNRATHKYNYELLLNNFTSHALELYMKSADTECDLAAILSVAAKNNYISIFKQLNFEYLSSHLNNESIKKILLNSINNNNHLLSNYLINYFNLSEQDYKILLNK